MERYYDLGAMDLRASYNMRIAMRKEAVGRLQNVIRWRREAHRASFLVEGLLGDPTLGKEEREELEKEALGYHRYCSYVRFTRVPSLIEWIRMIDDAIYEITDAKTRH